MAQTKQLQHRPGTRAPHGAPEYTDRIAIYCTAAQKKKFVENGGSMWLRRVIDTTMMGKVE